MKCRTESRLTVPHSYTVVYFMNAVFNETPEFAVSLQLACVRYPRKSLYIKRGNAGRGQLGS